MSPTEKGPRGSNPFHQERAYIAASRRGDRSMEARLESARRASEVHKKRTGKYLVITEEAVANEEMYEEEGDNAVAALRRLGAFYGGFGNLDKFRDHIGMHVGIRETLMQHQQEFQQRQQLSQANNNSHTGQPTMYAHHVLGQSPFMPTQQPRQVSSANFNQKFENSTPVKSESQQQQQTYSALTPSNTTQSPIPPPSPAVRNNGQIAHEAKSDMHRHSASASPALSRDSVSNPLMHQSEIHSQPYTRSPPTSTTAPSHNCRPMQQSQVYRQSHSRDQNRRRSRSPDAEALPERTKYRGRGYHLRNGLPSPGYTPTIIPSNLYGQTRLGSEENIPVLSIETHECSMGSAPTFESGTVTAPSQASDVDSTGASAQGPGSLSIKDPLSFALPPEIQQIFGSFLGPNHPSTADLMQGSENYAQPQNTLDGYLDYTTSKNQEAPQKATMYDVPSTLDLKTGVVTTPNDASNWAKNEALQWDFGFSLPEFGQNSVFDAAFPDFSNGATALGFNDPMFDMINFDALDSQV